MQINTEAILKLLPKRSWIILLVFTLIFAFIWLFPPNYLYFLKGLSSYLPLHMLMETFSIIVAAMIFAVGWEAYLKEKSGNIVIISTAFLAVVFIDFAHMLSFAGMPPFVTPSDPEKAIFFWLCGRFFVAFAMLYIAVNAWKPLRSSLSRYLILAVSLMATGLIYWVGLWHQDIIPHTFIPGHGLTPLKIYLEWSVVAVLAVTAVVMMAKMLKKKQEYDAENILMAISLMILSEIFFMMYADVADLYNFMGHVYKVIAYYYLYRAIFAENIQKPYKELELTTATISDLYNNAPCGYHSLDKDGVFIRINDTELSWLGYTREEVINKMKFSDILTQRSLGIFKENFPQFKERGWVNNLEFELIRKDGTTFPILVSATAIKDSKGNYLMSRSTVYDITDLKHAEDELQEKDRHAQSLLRLSKDLEMAQTYGQVVDTAREEVKTVLGYQNIWVYLFTEDKKYAYSLAAGGSMSDIVMSEEGTARLTITGDPMLEEIASAKGIVVVEDAQTDPRTDKKIVAQLGNHTIVNVPIIFFDRHMGSVGTGTFGDEGVRVPSKAEEEYLRALASHLAVTLDRIHLLAERKKAEEEIRKLNRIYRMLSDCNQALVRADNEDKLLSDVCKIITEEGGYRMVWVGYPQDDTDQTVKPVAHSGYEDGYLTQRRFSWGDNEYGRGPTGTAIRTGQYFTVLNYDTDSRFSPWREEAKKRGYASSVAFPLVTDTKPFGALSIYGGTSDVFDEAELTLLQELASDLAFGIMTIRTRIERERTQIMLNEAQRIAHLGSWHMDLATNEVFWSEELYNLYGFDPALPPPLYTESMKLFTPESWERLSTSIAKAVETGASYELELETTAQVPGGRKWMLARGELVRDMRGAAVEVRGVVMDITQRKWAEQEIRHANAYNRSLIEVSLDPLVTISPDGKITDVNAATEAVTGHTRDELIGTDFSDYFSEPEKAKAGYHQVFEAGFVKDYPLEIKDKEGNLTPVIYNASVYRDEEGNITGVFAAARDVTEQKKAESEIRKFNRIYKTLSACNESLVRAKDENELVSNICKIIVDEGGYRLVWVGYAQDDEEKTVKPVAYAGYEEGYLSNKKFSWGDNEYGRGPTGTAIRTGRLYMNPDSTKNANFAPWKEDALKRGYASSVAFPLSLNGKPMGALNIYGSVPDAFNDEEIKLLQELASDLAYGIATIRTRIGREHAQAMLNEAQRIAHLGNWELDLANNVLIWSDEIYRMFEIDSAQFGASYEAFLGAIHPDDRDAVNSAYTSSLETKQPYSIDHRLLFSDGRIKYVHEQCETYYDENGKPIRSVGTVQDVSEQKKAEKEILKLNRVYRTLSACNEALVHAQDEQSLLSDVCHIIVENGGYRMAWVGYKQDDEQKNVKPVAQAGYEEGYLESTRITWADEELGRGPTGTAIRTREISVNKDMLTNPLMLPWRDEAIKRGYASSIGLPLKDNAEAFASLTLYAAEPDAFNDEEVRLLRELAADLAYGIVTLRTRIERQEAEEALEQSERYLRSIIETSPLPMGSVNKEGVVTLLNDSFIKTFGYTIEDIHHVDMWFTKAYPDKEYREKTVGEWLHSIDEFVRSGTPMPPLEATITAKDGSSHVVDLYTTQVESETFVIFHDVTEKKHFEETIKHQNEQLESKVKERTAQLEATNKELESFTYSVSHDLRAPLRSIDGFSAVVMEDYGSKIGDEGKEYLQRVRNAAEKMGHLIDDLLSLSRLTRGELNKVEANISHIASEVVRTLREADPGRTVEVNISPDMTDEADPRLMEVVLTNLLNNAWKFTSKTDSAKIEFSCSEKEGKKIYCVRDNGAGFDMNYASKMFQPFQRLHTAEEFPGTGIGLATVYRIIKKHGGDIWAEGKVGEGAVFYFTLGQ